MVVPTDLASVRTGLKNRELELLCIRHRQESGADGWIRTSDTLFFRQVLYLDLSYVGKQLAKVVATAGFAPATGALSRRCSAN